MKAFLFVLLLSIPGAVSAQSTTGSFFVRNQVGRIGVEASLRAEPVSSALAGRFTALSRGRSITNGPTFYSRILVDKVNHTYLGYELLLEQKKPGAYLATFGRLGITPLDLAASGFSRRPDNSSQRQSSTSLEWNLLPLASTPEPRIIGDGDTIRIDLIVDRATGDKLLDEIRINPPRPVSASVPKAPTAFGPARDFSVADAELRIAQPRVILNQAPQLTSGPAALRQVHGALIWLYFPGHGRYILSLVPRGNLGFQRAGEVRGGVLTLAVDGDTIRLECMSAIAAGDAPYHLYVLHEEDWEPTAESQKDWPAAGTVGVEELTAVR